jgi:CBS-domain-containing membrane protein
LGTFLVIYWCICWDIYYRLYQSLHLPSLENVFLIGSFGASSVLVYGAIQSPLAQPRNLIGGHVVSAIAGVTVAQLLPDIIWLTAPFAVAVHCLYATYTRCILLVEQLHSLQSAAEQRSLQWDIGTY